MHYLPSDSPGLEAVLARVAGLLTRSHREDFFSHFCAELSDLLGMDRVWIAEYAGYPVRKLIVVAGCGDDVPEAGSELVPAHSPLEKALAQHAQPLWLPNAAPSAFKESPAMRAFAPESFAAFALVDSLGNPIGLVAAGHDKPVSPSSYLDTLLKTFASVAASELSRIRADRESQFLVGDLRQRMRELSCFYGLTESIRTREDFLDVCQDLAKLIPDAWQHPDIARSRVVVDGDEFVSEEFSNTSWGMSAAIVAGGRVRGSVQVFYMEDRNSVELGGPFLPAERNLLDALARTLGEAMEKREAEAAIREQSAMLARERNRLEAILRGIGDGVVVTDNRNHIMLLNPAAIDLLDIDSDRAMGEDFLDYLDDAAFIEAWRGESGDAPVFKHDLHVAQPVTRALTATRTRIVNLSQGLDGYVTILHDVTREREIEQMKSDFVSSVSHELRTPMTSIRGFASTLLRKPDLPEDRRQRFLSIISEESDRLLSMIEELLLISRMESGHITLEPSTVLLPDLIKRACVTLEPEVQKNQIALEFDFAENLPEIHADTEKLRIVFSNLIENAVKFTEPSGKITVRLRVEGDWICAEVEDTGVGIPERAIGQIFERFYRVHRPGATYPGTGLGLFIVHEIITLHGGTIDVASEAGQGTRFTVRLPLAGPAAVLAAADGEPEGVRG